MLRGGCGDVKCLLQAEKPRRRFIRPARGDDGRSAQDAERPRTGVVRGREGNSASVERAGLQATRQFRHSEVEVWGAGAGAPRRRTCLGVRGPFDLLRSSLRGNTTHSTKSPTKAPAAAMANILAEPPKSLSPGYNRLNASTGLNCYTPLALMSMPGN